MRSIVRPLLASALVCLSSVTLPVQATVIADSIAEFSGVQGQDAWTYGFYNQSTDADGVYNSATDFGLFDSFDSLSWRRTADGVASATGLFLRLSEQSGHPTGIGPGAQNEVIWAVRRYQSEIAGNVALSFDLRKENIAPTTGGITGRIFINGVEVLAEAIAGGDGTGIQDLLALTVNVGDFIDFAIDPTGPLANGIAPQDATSDATIFSARIQTVAEPSTVTLLGFALLAVGCTIRRRVA